MGKSSKKSNVEVAPAALAVPPAKSTKNGGKRNSDQVIATLTNAKKHKVAVAVPKKNGKKSKKVKAPAKVTNKPAKPREKEVSSSEESESSDEEIAKKYVPAKKQPSTLAANGMKGNVKTEQLNINAERDSDSEDNEDEDDYSDESSADELPKEQKNKPKVESNKTSDSEYDSSEESEDKSVKKPKKKASPQHFLPSEHRTLESFHIEIEAIRQEQNALRHMFTENAKRTRKYLEKIMSKLNCSSASEDDSSESEESEDEPVKKPKKKVNAQLLLPSELDALKSCQLEMKAIVQEQSALCRMLTENVKQLEKCVEKIMLKLMQMEIYLIMSKPKCPSSSGDDSSEESEDDSTEASKDDSSQESEDDSCEESEDETVKKPKKKVNSQPLLPSKPRVLESFRLLIEASRQEQNAFRRVFIKNVKLTKYLKSITLKLDWSSSSEED